MTNRARRGYALRSRDRGGYIVTSLDGKTMRSHRIIYCMMHGYWPEEVDHINGRRDDNRITNLRAVRRCEQMRNQKMNSCNKSGIVGVHWLKDKEKWRATIHYDRQKYVLIITDDFFEACCARKAAERAVGFPLRHGKRTNT